MNGHSLRVRGLLRWRNLRLALAVALVPWALWACSAHPLERPEPSPETQTDLLYEVNPLRQLDLLFMIDNSSSMDQEQDNIKANFPDFMNELQKIPGGVPDLHLAVISSNFGAGDTAPAPECPQYGDRGQFQVKAGCGLDPAANGGDSFLSIDAMGKQNFQGDLPTVFSCLASLGTQGCGYEHQLQSMRASLAGNVNTDAVKFLRKDAYLGIVLLSDEDDCSGEPTAKIYENQIAGQSGSVRCSLLGHVCNGQAVPAMAGFTSPLADCAPYVRKPEEKDTRLINVSEFVDYIKGIKNNRTDKILVSTVIGWSDDANAQYGIISQPSQLGGTEIDTKPICSQAKTGTAAPGIRLHTFAKSFENNTVASICSADLKQAMTDIGKKLANILTNTCITAPLFDTDLTKDGIQADCQVVDRIPDNSPTGYSDTPLPSCDVGQPPCWQLMADTTCGSGYRTIVNRPTGTTATPGLLQGIKCLTCTDTSTDPRCMRQ